MKSCPVCVMGRLWRVRENSTHMYAVCDRCGYKAALAKRPRTVKKPDHKQLRFKFAV